MLPPPHKLKCGPILVIFLMPCSQNILLSTRREKFNTWSTFFQIQVKLWPCVHSECGSTFGVMLQNLDHMSDWKIACWPTLGANKHYQTWGSENLLLKPLFGSAPTTPDPNTSAKVSRKWAAYRDIVGGVKNFFLPRGRTFEKVSPWKCEVYRDTFQKVLGQGSSWLSWAFVDLTSTKIWYRHY